MANGHVDEVGRQLCRLFGAGSASGLGDGELVQRLVDRGSEAAGSAFETILTRHGSMVLTVCRQVLGDLQRKTHSMRRFWYCSTGPLRCRCLGRPR
jgi:hypothetical protein